MSWSLGSASGISGFSFAFEQVFRERECISSASQMQIFREKFPGNSGQYSSHFGRAQEGCTTGK